MRLVFSSVTIAMLTMLVASATPKQRGVVIRGMSEAQVIAAWGKPDITTDAGAIKSMGWNDGRTVGFRDGRVLVVTSPTQ